MRRLTLTAVLFLACLLPLAAQRVPPAMLVTIEGKRRPITLSAVRTEVRIIGRLAETRMTMTFGNPHGRPLEGELCVPLPADSTVRPDHEIADLSDLAALLAD